MTSYEVLPYVNKPWFTKGSEEIAKDLELLTQKALELGATRSATILVDKIAVDNRAGYKCRIPPCNQYGKNLMCPPNSPKPSETRELLKDYRQAILIRKEFDPEGTCHPGYVVMPPEEAAKAIHTFRM